MDLAQFHYSGLLPLLGMASRQPVDQLANRWRGPEGVLGKKSFLFHEDTLKEMVSVFPWASLGLNVMPGKQCHLGSTREPS